MFASQDSFELKRFLVPFEQQWLPTDGILSLMRPNLRIPQILQKATRTLAGSVASGRELAETYRGGRVAAFVFSHGSVQCAASRAEQTLSRL
jgi:hypothetical protein